MPIDPDTAIGQDLPGQDFAWDPSDVVRYHLALGAGADATDPNELRYVYERDLQVLPTFVMTVPAVFGVAAPNLYRPEPPEISLPGVELRLADLLHGRQELVLHQPIPVQGKVRAQSTITDIEDRGSAAVLVQRTELTGSDGTRLCTAVSRIHAAGAGGFGGQRRTAAGAPRRPAVPDRAPDVVVDTPTLPQQALLYRLCGERNPMHVDPEFARAAGFARPILQGVCTYGMVCKTVVDSLLDADTTRVRRYSARFAGVVLPGETLRTRLWDGDGEVVLAASVPERDDTLVLSGTIATTPAGAGPA